MPLRRAAMEAGHASTNVLRDYLALALAGLGVSIPSHEYIAGVLLAAAGASVMARHRRDGRKVWAILGVAVFFATLTAIAWSAFEITFPVQIGMAATGVASGWIANFIAQFLNRVSSRADDIADRVVDQVVPEKRSDDE
ncbi:hypothetical protein GTA62_14805 [Roseobacter sp. HKCCD9010]|uniref:hypothetical protein n=1 Tax=unclassified Roseobacter TaxID=196798 RepID=UPI0014926E2B|nr:MULTISPECIES: hypothetical protein [unclassified Roseobacter]MBF9050619.1 hypothetical protein [Rhodobacterales bacterium HKCCD4356]NNV11963.1 hypothetical protein [Roseobacter sp. HKCCD7357]NNV16976.1 hypothetical protein [Roseobacter sp. HKCCD8768]NNV26205.1 hypothetical protein [Roseobacter sp. HKCCD8192]NNV30700.1 hypothetical protein [Roseobacter sp. HKCCD9061]